jgi:ribosomal protein S18 acetylase RimI-like enzyme
MIEIISAVPDDSFFMARVMRSVIPLYEPIMPGAFERQALRFERDGLPRNYNVSIIRLEGQPIGFVGFTSLTPEIAYLIALYLLPEHQRKGYGTKVLNMVVDSLSQKGIKEVILLVHQKAYWAINFYVKNGFRIITTNEDEIRTYANSTMERYVISSTILMGKRIASEGA